MKHTTTQVGDAGVDAWFILHNYEHAFKPFAVRDVKPAAVTKSIGLDSTARLRIMLKDMTVLISYQPTPMTVLHRRIVLRAQTFIS
jgi:hypothetical protein